MNESVYQIITEKILAMLEKGVVPWHQSWNCGGQAVQNLITRKPYRGVNVFLLNSMHYASPFWLSFKQAQELGGHVKRGEKSCPVVFWKWLDVEKDGEKQRIPLLRYYSVFNVAQCEGITVPTVGETSREHSPVKAAETIVAAMPKRPEIKHGLDRAFYVPSGDYVGMPNPEQFNTAESYYSTLFHELTHSTGHESRLNRKGVSGSDGQWERFGSDSYSREELVAELGASFLCGESGLIDQTLTASASYIGAWIKRLKDDSKLIVHAAAAAQRASDFILNRQHGEQAVS